MTSMTARSLGISFRREEYAPAEKAQRAIALKLRTRPGVIAISSAEEHRVLSYLQRLVAENAIPYRRLVTWSLVEGFREGGVEFVPWGQVDQGEAVVRRYKEAEEWLVGTDEGRSSFGLNEGAVPPPVSDAPRALNSLLLLASMIGPETAGMEAHLQKAQKVVVRRREDPHVLFVMRDLSASALERPEVQRMLRELRYQLSFTNSALVLLAPGWELPAGLESDISVERFPLPTPPELVDAAIVALNRFPPEVVGDLAERGGLIQAIAESCRGLTLEAARNAIEIAVLDQRGLRDGVVARVQEERRALIGKSQALILEDAKLTFDDVRDFEALEEYVNSRKFGFGPEARFYGLDAPKGVLLLGVPGGGKSAAAQAVARAWGLMLVRLNVGAVFGGLVGQSEANLRRVLEILDSIGPVLLWVDEIDKGLAMEGGGDSGTSMRVLQELLTWLQNRPGGTVCYFTANDISKVRPELLRKGRIDEIYFADLPGAVAREEILRVHLRRRGRDGDALDLKRVAEATEGFVGSELEQLVVEALYRARMRDADSPSTEDLLAAAEDTVPLVRTYAVRIAEIRKWVKDGRVRPASKGAPVPLEKFLSSHLKDMEVQR